MKRRARALGGELVVGLATPTSDSWHWFAWAETFRSWAEWQGYGNDTTGSFGT